MVPVKQAARLYYMTDEAEKLFRDIVSSRLNEIETKEEQEFLVRGLFELFAAEATLRCFVLEEYYNERPFITEEDIRNVIKDAAKDAT